nr:anaphase-promoting complex subunit 15 [Ipomoea batatas]
MLLTSRDSKRTRNPLFPSLSIQWLEGFKCSEIGKINSNLTVIGKTNVVDNDKEDFDNEAEDDDVDNGEESEGDDFDQETG